MRLRFTQLLIFLLITAPNFAQVSQNMGVFGTWNPGGFPSSGGQTYNDVWGYADCSGNEYAILGGVGYFHFIDVTNPSNPTEVASFAGGSITPWRDMKTWSSFAYGVCDSCGEGLSVFDMSDLPNSVSLVGQFTSSFGRAHNIFVDVANARLYAVGTDTQGNGVIVFDLAANPSNPPEIARFSLPGGYVHDMYVENNIGYANSGGNGMWVYDFSNLNNIVTLGSITSYPQSGYNHSSWVTSDGQGLVFADETHDRSLKYCDISNLNNISVTSLFRSELLAPGVTGSIAHNPFIRDDYVIISYYHDGLQIFDISDPNNITQEAWYDTYPNNTNYSGFEGNWGAYPFLPSGNILASDMSTGLYVLQATSFSFSTIPPPSAPIVSISAAGSTSFCQGGSVVLNATASGQSTLWFKDGVLIPNASGLSLTVTETGDYTATTYNYGCSATSNSITVTQISAPDATLNVPANNQICDGDLLTIAAPPGEPFYTWFFNGTPTGDTNDFIVATQQGTYQVEVGNGSCSTISDLVSLQVLDLPDVTMNVSGNQEICEDEVLTLSIPAGAGTYQWTKDGTPFGGNNNFITVTESGDYQVVAVTGICLNTSNIVTVTSISYPDVTLNDNGPIQLCNGEMTTLSVPPNANAYQWFFNGNQPIGNNSIIDVSSAGDYFVEATNGNCLATSATVTIEAGNDPDVTLNVPLQNDICTGDVLQMSVPSGADTYTWFLNGNAQGGSNSPNFIATTPGDYYVIAETMGCSSISDTVVLNVNTIPDATLNVGAFNEICEGENLVIEVPFGAQSYQWFLNGNPTGITSNAITATAAGMYAVEATNGNCTITSSTTQLMVNATPNVDWNVPTDNQICEGENLMIAIAAGASSYQWFLNGNALNNSTNELTANQEGTYAVVAANGNCSATSQTVNLDINSYPATSLNVPLDNEICEGNAFEITVPSGAESYLWLENGVATSETSNSISPTQTGNYQVIAANGTCSSTSELVNLTVTNYPDVSLNVPLENELCEGEDLTIAVAVGAENYEWFLNGNTLSETSASLTVSEAGIYTVNASNSSCALTSESVEVAVNAFPDNTLNVGTEQQFCEGESLSISVPAGAESYQWFNNGTTIPFNENMLIVSESGNYQIQIANGSCQVESETVNVQVDAYPEATLSVPTTNNLCEGETLTIAIPSGANTYAWYLNGELLDETDETLTVSAAGNYQAIASNNDCATTSEVVVVTVTPLPDVALSVGDMVQICENETVTIELAGDADSFSWYQNGNLLPINGNILTVSEAGDYQVFATNGNCELGSEIVNVIVVDAPDASLNVGAENEICSGEVLPLEVTAGASNYQWFLNGEMIGNNEPILNASAAGDYYVEIGSGDCSTTSQTANLTVISTPTVALNVEPEVSICEGESLELSVTDDAENYIWYFNNEVIFSGESAVTITEPGIYYVVAANGSCETTSEQTIISTIDEPNVALNVAAENEICEDETFEVIAPMGAENYQWFLNDELVGEGNNVFAATESGTYYLQANNGNCMATSTTFSLLVTAYPNVQLTPNANEQAICEGEIFDVAVPLGADEYDWFFNNASTGETAAQFSINEAGSIYVIASNGDCPATSETINLIVHPFPNADILTDAVVICEGEIANLSTPSSGEAYQWFLDGVPISGANETAYEATTGGTYSVSVTENGCTAVSVNLVLTVNIAVVPEIDFDGEMLLSSPANTYQWYLNGELIEGATESMLMPTENGDYYLQTTDDNGCTAISEVLNITLDAVQDVALSNQFLLFPNPTSDVLILKHQGTEAIFEANITLYNSVGQKVFANTINPQNGHFENLKVKDLAKGVYFLKLETVDGRFFIRRFVKQ